MSWKHWLFGVLFALSVLLNAGLLWSTLQKPKKATGSALTSPFQMRAPAVAPLAKLKARLKTCEEQHWNMASRLLTSLFSRVQPKTGGGGFAKAPKAPPPRGPSAPASPSSTPKDPGRPTVQQSLCMAAQDHLRQTWTRSQDKISQGLQYLTQDGRFEQNLKQELKTLSKALGLSPQELETHRSQYSQIYRKHLGSFVESLRKDPQDWSGMFRAARGYYRAQDAFIQKVFGQDARRQFRDNQHKARASLLALLGLFGKKDWKKISW